MEPWEIVENGHTQPSRGGETIYTHTHSLRSAALRESSLGVRFEKMILLALLPRTGGKMFLPKLLKLQESGTGP